MPWSANDFPSAMKKLSPEARRYAISIANGILKSGGEESTAIATGIARAEEKFGKNEKKGSSDRAFYLSQIPE